VTDVEAVVRPPLHRWLWYALGGRLPQRHRAWVLHDTTTGTWWLRHVARVFVQMAVPIALVLIVLPAPFGLRAAVAAGEGRRRVLHRQLHRPGRQRLGDQLAGLAAHHLRAGQAARL